MRSASPLSDVEKNILNEDLPAPGSVFITGFAEAYHWQVFWNQYAKSSEIFFCPSGQKNFKENIRYSFTYPEILVYPLRQVWGHYGVNYERFAKFHSHEDRSISTVEDPASVFIVMDSWSVSPAVDGANSPRRWFGTGGCNQLDNFLFDDVGIGLNCKKGDPRRADRHAGQINVLFTDGHVHRTEPKRLLSLVPSSSYSPFTDYEMGNDPWQGEL